MEAEGRAAWLQAEGTVKKDPQGRLRLVLEINLALRLERRGRSGSLVPCPAESGALQVHLDRGDVPRAMDSTPRQDGRGG